MRTKAIVLMLMSGLVLFSQSLTDRYVSVNEDGTVTYAVTVTDVNEGDLLTIIRKAGGIYTTMVGNGDYHPFEWSEGDTITVEGGAARFADTFPWEWDTNDRVATYRFLLNYQEIATDTVNFNEGMDVQTGMAETIHRDKDVIYDLNGNRVDEMQPNRIYIINGLKKIAL